MGDAGANMGAIFSGQEIALIVRGRDFAVLEEIAVDVAELVASVEGTEEVSDGIDRSEPELRVILDKEKSIAHGLTVAQVFMEVNDLLSSEGVNAQDFGRKH